jgi:hypothetical protein
MVKFIGAEGAGELAFKDGLKMVFLSNFSQCFWVIQPAEIFQKKLKVDF